MSIYWVRFQGESAADVMRAVAAALQQDDRGAAPDQAAAPAPATTVLAGDDEYVQRNLTTLHTQWSIDPLRPDPPVDQRLISRALVHAQHFIRRITRWYVMNPWLQTNEFHAAVVRIIDVILDRNDRLHRELYEMRYRLQSAEQQVNLLRNELAITRQHLLELRQQLYRAEIE